MAMVMDWKDETLDREALFEQNQGLVYHVLKKYRTSNIQSWYSMDDLEQVARIALWRASQRYDPSRGAFSTLAVVYITTAAKDFLRENRRKYGGHPILSLSKVVWEGDKQDVEFGDTLPGNTFDSTGIEFRAFLRSLHRKHSRILELRAQGLTQAEVSQVTGISQPHVARLIRRMKREWKSW